MPSQERDHRGPDRDVEDRVEDLGRTPGEERQQPELNGVGDDRDGPRGENAALPSLHARTLFSAGGDGQTPSLARSYGSIERQSGLDLS